MLHAVREVCNGLVRLALGRVGIADSLADERAILIILCRGCRGVHGLLAHQIVVLIRPHLTGDSLAIFRVLHNMVLPGALVAAQRLPDVDLYTGVAVPDFDARECALRIVQYVSLPFLVVDELIHQHAILIGLHFSGDGYAVIRIPQNAVLPLAVIAAHRLSAPDLYTVSIINHNTAELAVRIVLSILHVFRIGEGLTCQVSGLVVHFADFLAIGVRQIAIVHRLIRITVIHDLFLQELKARRIRGLLIRQIGHITTAAIAHVTTTPATVSATAAPFPFFFLSAESWES